MRHLRAMPKGLGVVWEWNWVDGELVVQMKKRIQIMMMRQLKRQEQEVNQVKGVMMSIAWTL